MDKVYLGSRAGALRPGIASPPITKVELLDANGDLLAQAGTDEGRVLTSVHPDATDTMAQSILAKVRGYVYQPFEADDALLDPAAELGDGVTVGGIYATLLQEDADYADLFTADISAPQPDDLEDEYPYVSPVVRLIQSNYQTVRSSITKTAEEIRQEISGKIGTDDAKTLIKQSIEDIELSVSSTSGGTTTFQLTAGGASLSTQTLDLKVKAVNISGTLKANQIDATNLRVNAANIDGTLTIGKLPSNVATTGDIPTNVSELRNDKGYQTERGVTTIIDGTVTADYINALGITAVELDADAVLADNINLEGALKVTDGRYILGHIGDYKGMTDGVGLFGPDSDFICVATSTGAKLAYVDRRGNDIEAIYVTDDACHATSDFIIDSDRRLKENISYGLERYSGLFDRLRPCWYRLKKDKLGRVHLGLIAQDVLEAVKVSGSGEDELALVHKSGDYYGIGYGELISLCIYKIQQLEARLGKETA